MRRPDVENSDSRRNLGEARLCSSSQLFCHLALRSNALIHTIQLCQSAPSPLSSPQRWLTSGVILIRLFHRPLKTFLTEKVGIEIPVVQGGMM